MDWDRDLKITNKKKRENPEIPGIGVGILKGRNNPEQIPRAKSRNPGDQDRDFKIPKNPEIPGIRIGILHLGFFRGFSGSGIGNREKIRKNLESKIQKSLESGLGF